MNGSGGSIQRPVLYFFYAFLVLLFSSTQPLIDLVLKNGATSTTSNKELQYARKLFLLKVETTHFHQKPP